MAWIVRAAHALALGVVLTVLFASDALAQACWIDADCRSDLVCKQGFFGAHCAEMRCNFNSNCPSTRPLCSGGRCLTTTTQEGECSCARDLVCKRGLFGTQCAEVRCNFNVDCPNSRSRCAGGRCQTTTTGGGGTGGGGGGGGGGISPSGEGGRCGPQRFGQVIKPVPCRPGLQCVNGRCIRPRA
jgi:hypothetical protein